MGPPPLPAGVETMTTEITKFIDADLAALIRDTYTLDWYGIHGVSHWIRVAENGLRLAEETGADPKVVTLFAFLHDLCRRNDGNDPEHGARAAIWITEHEWALGQLTPIALDQLRYACEFHTHRRLANDPTIQSCWDADRLDYGRINVRPNPHFLGTAAARRPEVLAWAWERSQAYRRSLS